MTRPLHRHRALSTHPEQQYLDLLETLLAAPERPDRTGTGTRGIFGARLEFDLARGFPLLTTKKLPFRVIAAELLWMLSGSTSVRPLQDQGVTIWDEWADEAGELGPVYGAQWRSWQDWSRNLSFRWDGDGAAVAEGGTIDQVANVLASLQDDPHGRRHIVSAWNPADVPDMALPPCHMMFQFYVEADGRLSCQMYQRSADAFLGLPFNIASYALLLSLFGQVLRRQPGRLIWVGGDTHLYLNHVEQAEVQILRDPRPFPRLMIDTWKPDMDHWTLNDFGLDGYEPWLHIAGEVSV